MFTPVSFLGKIFKWYLLFPAHPSKIRIENKLGSILFKLGIKIKNNDGVVLNLDANDWITRIMIEQGSYESESLTLGKVIVSTGGVFIDVGANFGLYSCILGFKNNGLKVFAIEPNYRVVSLLSDNIKLNHLSQQVQIINTAISNKTQFLYLEQPEKNNLGTTMASSEKNDGVSILSCPLLLILEANNINQVDLLKIDIEGNEFSVFEYFPFEKYLIRNIILEFNFLSKISFKELKQFFDIKGFAFFTIKGEKLDSDAVHIPENNIWVVNKNFIQ